jgi:hypothetical protein
MQEPQLWMVALPRRCAASVRLAMKVQFKSADYGRGAAIRHFAGHKGSSMAPLQGAEFFSNLIQGWRDPRGRLPLATFCNRCAVGW